MYASIDFATKKDFRLAIKQGLPVVCYSPAMGVPAINGKATVIGPWPTKGCSAVGSERLHRNRGFSTWQARVDVKDMRIVAVH